MSGPRTCRTAIVNLATTRREDLHAHSAAVRLQACAKQVPKIAVMAWYRLEFERPAQLPPMQGFTRMRSKSEASDAQSEESQSQQVTGAESAMYRGGVARLLRAVEAAERY